MGTIRPTRYRTLGYRCDGPKTWRIYDTSDDSPAAVGPFYATKAELLADLDRYAREFGVTDADRALGVAERHELVTAMDDCWIRSLDEDRVGCGVPTSVRYKAFGAVLDLVRSRIG